MDEQNHVGIETWGKNRRCLRNKKSKIELMTEISKLLHTTNLDLSSLDRVDLQRMLKNITGYIPELPCARTKAPYIDQLKKCFPSVKHFEKLSINGLKTLIQAVRNERHSS